MLNYVLHIKFCLPSAHYLHNASNHGSKLSTYYLNKFPISTACSPPLWTAIDTVKDGNDNWQLFFMSKTGMLIRGMHLAVVQLPNQINPNILTSFLVDIVAFIGIFKSKSNKITCGQVEKLSYNDMLMNQCKNLTSSPFYG